MDDPEPKAPEPTSFAILLNPEKKQNKLKKKIILLWNCIPVWFIYPFLNKYACKEKGTGNHINSLEPTKVIY